jgi:glycosyltransferase involved in cell wall biosynthesis
MNIVLKGQLNYLDKYFEITAITGFDEKHFNDILERERVKMVPINFSRTISPLNDLICLIKLIKLILKEKPQIIHSHTPKAGLLGMLAAFICRTPIRIHTVTGLPLMGTKGIKRFVLEFIERITYGCATKVYPNSHSLKKFIIENNYTTNDKLKVLLNGSTNGVDTDFFDPTVISDKELLRKQFNMSKDAFVFVFIGRIAKEKGIEELVSAFEKLDVSYPQKNIKLVLIGKLERHYGLLNKTTEEKIFNHKGIQALGRFDDVRPFYKMADLFVLPSYREGFPNAVLEAGAMGLPSIVTNINGCNEIIENNMNGLIITPKNQDDLYIAMEKFLIDSDLLANTSLQSRSNIIRKYQRNDMHLAIKNEYSSLINHE